LSPHICATTPPGCRTGDRNTGARKEKEVSFMICAYDLVRSLENNSLKLVNFEINKPVKVSDSLFLIVCDYPAIAVADRDAASYYNIDVEIESYVANNFTIIFTNDPELTIVKRAVFSKFHSSYIPVERAIFSNYLSDYLYDQDTVYSKYLCSYIYSRDAKYAWDNDRKAYDWIPPELAVEIYQCNRYVTAIKYQVYEKDKTWYYTNGEIVG